MKEFFWGLALVVLTIVLVLVLAPLSKSSADGCFGAKFPDSREGRLALIQCIQNHR